MIRQPRTNLVWKTFCLRIGRKKCRSVLIRGELLECGGRSGATFLFHGSVLNMKYVILTGLLLIVTGFDFCNGIHSPFSRLDRPKLPNFGRVLRPEGRSASQGRSVSGVNVARF